MAQVLADYQATPRVRAGPDQQAEPEFGRFQVVVYLGTVLVGQLGHGFNLHDDLVEAEEIGLVLLHERAAFVAERQFELGLERDFLHAEFQAKALLVDRLDEAGAFLFVDLEAGTEDAVGFGFVEEWHGGPFR
jgi:hypothetical protein